MADPYIDQYETIAYGRFAVSQILSLLVGLDFELDPFIKTIAARLAADTDAMEAALAKAGALEGVTYKAPPGKPDAVAEARDALRRVVRYAESRRDGAALAARILLGQSLTTVLRRRPVKLAAALGLAIDAIDANKDQLPEHEAFIKDLTAARDALSDLNEGVRKARTDRRKTTPEVTAARGAWLRRYTSTKLIVEGILKAVDRTALLPEIFDDLAEFHRAPGVSDEPAEPT